MIRTRYGNETDLSTALNQSDNGNDSAAAPMRYDATMVADFQWSWLTPVELIGRESSTHQ
jgi:hypothetical protein